MNPVRKTPDMNNRNKIFKGNSNKGLSYGTGKIALLDFDDVLFNTRAYSEEIKGMICQKTGLTSEEYEWAKEEFRDKLLIKNTGYHQNDQMLFLQSKFPNKDWRFLKKGLSKLKRDMPHFVFADSRAFLKHLSQEGWHRAIVTFGHDGWQRTKVYSSGMGDMVEDVIVASEPSKVSAIGRILNSKKAREAIFIDDNPFQALNLVKAEFPHIRTFQLIRPELESLRQLHTGCDHDCSSLDEIKEILLS